MRFGKSEHVGDVVRQFLRSEGLETPLNQHKLIAAWPEVMGEGIRRYTGEVFIKNQTLFVQIRSSVLRQELNMTKANLIAKLNGYVNAQVICDIKFY